MPMYDRRCNKCEYVKKDQWENIRDSAPLPCTCGGQSERVILSMQGVTTFVIGDDIPGGVLIRHGICNADGTPKRYDSKTEIRRACKMKGLSFGYDENKHIPKRGSDKSDFTRKW